MNTDITYSVYMHISPDGKRYIGQCKDVSKRWKKGGIGYKKDNPYFWADIQKYGWDRFKHIVVQSQLTKEAALKLESDLIHQYHTIESDKGYNHRTGSGYKGEISESYREQLRQHQLTSGLFANSCWVSNDTDSVLIRKDQLDLYLAKGYHEGRDSENAIYITKDGITKRIKSAELSEYLQQGWETGKSAKLTANIRKSQQQYIWVCDTKEFNSAAELAKYLRSKYYPKIVPSTITSIFRGKHCPAYPDLLKIVSRRPVEN